MGCADRVQRRCHHCEGIRSARSAGESGCADAAPGSGEDRGDSRRRHEHRDDPRARDLLRWLAQRDGGRECDRSQEGTRQVPEGRGRSVAGAGEACRQQQGEGPGCDDLGSQRRDDRRARRPGDGEGRRRGCDHRRGIQDHGNDPGSGRGYAVRSWLHVALLRHRYREDGGRARRRAHPAHRSQDQHHEGSHRRCWSRSPRAASRYWSLQRMWKARLSPRSSSIRSAAC